MAVPSSPPVSCITIEIRTASPHFEKPFGIHDTACHGRERENLELGKMHYGE